MRLGLSHSLQQSSGRVLPTRCAQALSCASFLACALLLLACSCEPGAASARTPSKAAALLREEGEGRPELTGGRRRSLQQDADDVEDEDFQDDDEAGGPGENVNSGAAAGAQGGGAVDAATAWKKSARTKAATYKNKIVEFAPEATITFGDDVDDEGARHLKRARRPARRRRGLPACAHLVCSPHMRVRAGNCKAEIDKYCQEVDEGDGKLAGCLSEALEHAENPETGNSE